MSPRSAGLRRLASVLGVALALSGAVALGAGPASASDGAMLASVNASRAAHGHSAYAWSSDLASVAQGQAQRMADKHLLYHNPNLSHEVGSFRWVGENVGYGPTSDVIETAFMNSPMHRANILDSDFTQIGIGSVRDSHGRLWVAQVFREPLGGGGGGSTPTVHKRTHHAAKGRSTPNARHRVTHATTHRANATTATPTARTARTTRHRATPHASPSPAPTLAQRVSLAEASGTGTGSDPLADTLQFAVTMSAVGN